MVIVLATGNSGSRLIAKLLKDNGIWTGRVNGSYDTVPPTSLFKAVKIAGTRVKTLGPTEWDFSQILSEEPTNKFTRHIHIGTTENHIYLCSTR